MIEKEKSNTSCDNVTSCRVPSRPSLFKTLEAVKLQIGYEDFGRTVGGRTYIESIYLEICLIIAEMLVRPPETTVRIRSADTEASIVQEVYKALEHEHIELVVDSFKRQTRLIHKKTAYLQTALYNALFEIDTHYVNLVRHDMHNPKI
jgi:hypothetical protein